MLDKTLYILFLVLSIIGANIGLGGVAFRDILTIVLFFVMVTKIGLFWDQCIKAYIIFVFCFAIGCIVTNNWDFMSLSILRYYMVSFLGWSLTLILIGRDKGFKRTILNTIILIGIFDAIVTIGQFTMNTEWYTPLESFFKLPVYDDYSVYEGHYSNDEVYARFLPGLFGNPVINGYYLAICSVVSMYYIIKTKKMYMYSLPIIFMIATFVCQERSALGIAAIFLLYVTMRYIVQLQGIQKFLVIAIMLIGLAYIGSWLFAMSKSYDLRYSALGTDDTGRSEIYRNTLLYIMDNPFFPCVKELKDLFQHAPHNIFLNAYVYGGPISFFAIMYILFIQSKKALSLIRIKLNDSDQIITFLITCGWITFTLNSLVHNRSVVTGELICWVMWAIMSDAPDKEESDEYEECEAPKLLPKVG